MTPLLRSCVCLALAVLLALPTALAQDEKKKAQELAAVKQRIESIRQSLQREAQRRDALTGELKEVDMSVQAAREQLAAVRERRRTTERQIAELERERADITQHVARERTQLAAEVKLAYINGTDEHLRMLLNQQDPVKLGRMLVYYSYLGRMRADRIQQIQEQLAHLELVSEKIAEEHQRLEALEREQAQEVAGLAKARERRAATLAQVQARLKDRNSQLAKLERDAKGLERLIAELRRAAQDFPDVGNQPFAKTRGKLPWPVRGKLLSRFGQARGGGLKWQGITIGASRGTQVRAPYPGRVLYADWLAGMGLLVVVDHGGGFMSLYGHNEQLYRKVGDRVQVGDVIGAVGDGGPSRGTGLYFEIRQGRQALDPVQWLTKP